MNFRAISSTVRIEVLTYLVKPVWVVEFLLAPFAYSVVTLMIFKRAEFENYILYVLIGSGALGMWTGTLYSGQRAIERERHAGTIEYVLITPSSLQMIIVGKTITSSLIGLSTLVVVLGVFAWSLGAPVTIAHPTAFLVAILGMLVSLSVMGIMLSASFVLSRSAGAMMNALSRSVFVLCGVMFPVALLPDWVKPLSYLLSPTWGIEAAREAALNGATHDFYTDSAVLLLLTAVYAVSSQRLFQKILYLAKGSGELGRY
jgi:ABC-2 type transport system permease protein